MPLQHTLICVLFDPLQLTQRKPGMEENKKNKKQSKIHRRKSLFSKPTLILLLLFNVNAKQTVGRGRALPFLYAQGRQKGLALHHQGKLWPASTSQTPIRRSKLFFHRMHFVEVQSKIVNQ